MSQFQLHISSGFDSIQLIQFIIRTFGVAPGQAHHAALSINKTFNTTLAYTCKNVTFMYIFWNNSVNWMHILWIIPVKITEQELFTQ